MPEINRILITSIGNHVQEINNDNPKRKIKEYVKTEYRFSDRTAGESVSASRGYETSFIVEALVKEYHPNHIVIVGTVGSFWRELYEYYAMNRCDDSDESMDAIILNCDRIQTYFEGLNYESDVQIQNNRAFSFVINALLDYFNSIEKINIKTIRIILLKYGINNEETRENFLKFREIEKCIENDKQNEISLDITHSFRSLPFYQFMFTNYLIHMKRERINLKNVYYGMFEASKELGYTPIVNLNSLTDFQEWTGALDAVNDYGSVSLISRLLDDDNSLVNNGYVNELIDWLNIFEYASNTNDIPKLFESVDMIQSFDFVNDCRLTEEKCIILDQWKDNLSKTFVNDVGMREGWMQYTLAKWYYDQHRYGFCRLILQETVITISALFNKEIDKNKNKDVFDEGFRCNSIDVLLRCKDILGDKKTKKMLELYSERKKKRNVTAHGLYNDSEEKDISDRKLKYEEEIKKEKEELGLFLESVEDVLKEASNLRSRFKRLFEDSDVQKNMANGASSTIFIGTILVLGRLKNDISMANDIRGKYKNASIVLCDDDEIIDMLESSERTRVNSISESVDKIVTKIDRKYGHKQRQTIVAIPSMDFLFEYSLVQRLNQRCYQVFSLRVNKLNEYYLCRFPGDI